MKIGDRVTHQPMTWYDGKSVANWPNPEYVGTVRAIITLAGVLTACVQFGARKEWTSVSRLFTVPA